MFKRIKRTSLVLGIALTVILGMSYGTFIFTTNSFRSTEMLVGNLTYGIEITSTGGSETINGTSVSLTSGKTSTVLLKITSLNKIISKYGIDYKMSSGTGSVKYASNTGWLPTGKINENNVGTYEKIIKVVISATTDVTVDFTVTGGYSNNDLIEVKEGYTRLTEVYDGIVDYKEDLKTIISKETTNNIYGGEAINNYLQYPTNTDATKNIWRVLGYYNSVDGIKAVSNQTSTTVQSNITSSLTSFYNTLEKQEDFILETNKFNCTNTTCTTSSYSNIGLLSTSEYNMLGGVNSYLASSESYFGLDNTTIKNITSSGITDTTTSTTSGYINSTTYAFNSSYNNPMYVGYMYGTSGSLVNNRKNTTNSTIKDKIDTWYTQNMTSYTKYLSTTAVYCNDRTEQTSGTYNTGKTSFYYAPHARAYTNYAPTYDCTETSDAFSGSNTSAKLTYPIALMTSDEIMRAGGRAGANLTSPYAWYYLNSANGSITGSQWWWLLSPRYWNGTNASVFSVRDSSYPGYLDYDSVDCTHGVRPAVSLKSCVKTSGGDGSASAPYTIEETETGC